MRQGVDRFRSSSNDVREVTKKVKGEVVQLLISRMIPEIAKLEGIFVPGEGAMN